MLSIPSSPKVRMSERALPCSIRGDAGDALADDEGVHFVCALVGLDRLEIHHVAHDGIVLRDAVGPKKFAGDASALEGHPHVVALGHGDVFVADGSGIFHAAHL